MLEAFLEWVNSVAEKVRLPGGDASVTMCNPSSNSAVRVDIDTPKVMARITFWASGDYVAEALDAASGNQICESAGIIQSREIFDIIFQDFFLDLGIHLA